MKDSLLNLVFRCPHRRLTRPVTPVGSSGQETYVVCLDCGKQFSYDIKEMRMGKAVRSSEAAGVLEPAAKPKRTKLRYAALALPAVVVLGKAFLRGFNRKEPGEKPGGDGLVR